MLRWLVGIFFMIHGLGHVMGFLGSWTKVPVGFAERPWIFSGGVGIGGPLGRAFGVLWLVAMVAWVGAGLRLLSQQDWWPSLAVVSAVVSLVAIVPWWNTVVPGARFGATLVDVVAILGLALPWGERIADTIAG